jgi:forespore regulator of the sigma-K checkpoint
MGKIERKSEKGGFSMGFYRQIRKRFRLKRLLFPLFSIVLLGVAFTMFTNQGKDQTESPVYQPIADTNAKHVSLSEDANTYMVVKKLRYICGEETKQLGSMSGSEIYSMLKQQDRLKLVWGPDGQAIIEESIDDLSPACKGKVYFSMDAEGNLTLFEGNPDANKVLQTFFQIDVNYLESSLPREAVESLYEGIRISDYASYNSVLSTYAGYAVEADPQ